MIGLIQKLKIKRRLKKLKERKLYLEQSISDDKYTVENFTDKILFTNAFYRNLENLEMELADVKDEIRANEKKLKG